VFTHLSGNSAAWLLELHRVIEPGGLLMASYMGKYNSEEIAARVLGRGQDRDERPLLRPPVGRRRPDGPDVGLAGGGALRPRLRDPRPRRLPRPDLDDDAEEGRPDDRTSCSSPATIPANGGRSGTTSSSSSARSS
jgi:hypothetical protein